MQVFLNNCEVERIPNEHPDLLVVNSARVSNAKRVSEIVTKQSNPDKIEERKTQGIRTDDSLISYLAKNNHWTPFAHPRFGFMVTLPKDYDWSAFLNWSGDPVRAAGFHWMFGTSEEGDHTALRIFGSLFGWARSCPPLGRFPVNYIHSLLEQRAPLSFAALDPAKGSQRTLGESRHDFPGMICDVMGEPVPDSETFRIKIPLMIARQLMRSNVGIVYNEMSRRYVSDQPELWTIEQWRASPESGLKQGSGEPMEYSPIIIMEETCEESSLVEYENRIKSGVAPELARGCLPYTTMTEMWMTATYPAINRLVGLRSKDETGKNHPQFEIQELIKAMCREL